MTQQSQHSSKTKANVTGLEIAVIGMAGQFPSAENIRQFWNNLKQGKEAVTFFSDEELKEGGDPQLIDHPNYVNAGFILEEKDCFDESFFGYTPAEAEVMAPHLRLFYQCAWWALEDAGYDPGAYNGLIGCYVGSNSSFNWQLLSKFSGRMNELGPLTVSLLNDRDTLSTRLAYKLDLKGPCFSLYTACSTSLLAIHLASRALLTGECSMALAGGVSINTVNTPGYLYEEGMIDSRDGHCRTFDTRSSGTLFGDGLGAVVLKRYPQAVKDRDHIYAVIKGSAVNNDGTGRVGYTAPGTLGQREVVKLALRVARTPSETITYVETHGTGTALGDPVEIEALKQAFNTNKKHFCALGSVKTNVGHLDTAAGVTSLIKTVLALKHRLIPPSLHFEHPNPGIDFSSSPFYVNTGPKEWKNPNGPLRAGVSAFGIGGTNAHVILEETPMVQNAQRKAQSEVPTAYDVQYQGRCGVSPTFQSRQYQLILLSARTETALDKMTENLVNFLKENRINPVNPVSPGQNPGLTLADVAYTLQVGRRLFPHRRMLVGSTPEEVSSALSNPGSANVNTFSASKENQNPPVVFMFSGLGSEYVNMGRELYEKEPYFRQQLDRCFEILKTLVDYDIKEVIYPSPGINRSNKTYMSNIPEINQIEIAHVVIFIFEYALAKLLMHWGIIPRAMIGYSFGEYSAACISGVFSLADALRLVKHRGELITRTPAGIMLNVPLPKKELMPLLPPQLSLAIDNNVSCLVAGPKEDVEVFAAQMRAKKCLCVPLPTSKAVHSPTMEPILTELESKVREIKLNVPGIPYISNVTGAVMSARDAVNPGYWSTHMRETVQFAQGIKTLVEKEKNALFLEIGPGRDISSLVLRYIRDNPQHRIISLVRHPFQRVSDVYFLLNQMGRLWLYGKELDWNRFYFDEVRQRVSLPGYPFEKNRYLAEGNPFAIGLKFLAQQSPAKETRDSTAAITPEPLPKPAPWKAPLPTTPSRVRPNLMSPYVAPQTPVETTIAQILQKMFGYEKIGIEDDFFELGIDSIKMIQIRSRLNEQEYNVELADFFQYPTISQLAPLVKPWESPAPKAGEEGEVFTYQQLPPGTLEQIKKQYSVEDIYPLGPMQEGMLFHSLYERKNTPMYFEQMSYRLEGRLDIPLVEKSLNELLKRHEVLRTRFIYEGVDRPLQIVLKEQQVEFYYEDLRHIPGENNEAKELFINEYREKDRAHSFNLSNDPLMRVAVIQPQDHRYEIIWSYPHILMDGWCLGIVLAEFFEIYSSYVQNRPHRLAAAKPYRTYIQWLESLDKEEMNRYWKTYLEGYEEAVGIPKKKSLRTFEEQYQAASAAAVLEEKSVRCLQHIAAQHHVTLNTLFQAIWGILLGKYNGKQEADAVFGGVVSGRPHQIQGVENMIGCFINAVPVRIQFNPHTTFKELILEIQKKAIQSEPYHYSTLAEIQNQTPLKQNLLDHIFEFQNFPLERQMDDVKNKIKMEEKQAKSHRDNTLALSNTDIFEQGNYDLSVVIIPREQLVVSIGYNARVYDKEIVERVGFHSLHIIHQVIENEAIIMGEITLLSEVERRQILLDFNDNAADFSRDKSITRLMEKHAAVAPHRIALVEEDEKTGFMQYISYQELNQQANEFSRVLLAAGIHPDDLVGILMTRSRSMVMSILAVWKAGGAYIPIDRQYPVKRIMEILNDSDTRVLIASASPVTPGLQKAYPGKIISLAGRNQNRVPQIPGDVPGNKGNNPHLSMDMNFLAYVIYTSGSTGRPKGAMVEHMGMMNHIQAKINDLHLTAESIVVQNATHTFDISVWQFFTPLTLGGKTVIYPDELVMDPHEFISRLVKDQATILEVVPSYLSILLDTGNENFSPDGKLPLSLDYLLVTGEEVQSPLVSKWFQRYPGIKMVNAYGPTEASDDITHHVMLSPPDRDRIPIGRPLQNFNISICDDNMQLCPVGVKGEIYVSGIGVGRGYLNNPELTNQKFFRGGPGGAVFSKIVPPGRRRQYKTGDLGRWLPDGSIEFFGRKDHQVKIRGFRIELGEIENQLMKHPIVTETVVMDREDETGNKYLCAYVITSSSHFNQSRGCNELKEYLSGSLPDYMVPSHFLVLEKLPITPNGKLDRKSLPAPEINMEKSYMAPGNKIERELVNIWSKVLGRDASRGLIGIDDDFFSLGGHSLKAMMLMSSIHQAFEVKVPLAEIFRLQTIRELSRYIQGSNRDEYAVIEPVEKQEYYPVSSAQNRLYLLQQLDPDSVVYNIPCSKLLEMELHPGKLGQIALELIRRYEGLRTSFELIEGNPVQRVHPAETLQFEIEFYDSTTEAIGANSKSQIPNPKQAVPSGQVNAFGEIIQNETMIHHSSFIIHHFFIRPFNLSQLPLLRVGVVKLAKTKYMLMADMHHIITDGLSMNVFINEALALYLEQRLPPLRLQYKDFSQWQHTRRQQKNPILEGQRQYWLNQLEGELPVLNLPTDYPRPKVQRFEGDRINYILGPPETRQLRELAASAQATLYNVLVTILNILFSKLSGQEDIILGIGTAGRWSPELENIIGMFVNTLVLRNYPSAEKTFYRFLEEVKEKTLSAFDNQDYPFEDLVAQLLPKRDRSRNPLFDIIFAFNNFNDPNTAETANLNSSLPLPPSPSPGIPQSELTRENEENDSINPGITKFDISIIANESAHYLSFLFEYSTALFKKETIRRFINYFQEIISVVIENKDILLKDIAISYNLLDARLKVAHQEFEDFEF